MNTLTLDIAEEKTSRNRTATITGAEAVIRCLLEEGVDTIFGYPGGAIMPVYDALYHYRDKVNHILVRHEQGATHAAEGYARITGKAGVCIATSGPGATNLVTGIADALMDSVPMVCIVGQVSRSLLGTDAFQEADVIGITMPITKWNYQVTAADEIPSAIAKAFYIACSGRPGPVVLDITKNAQFENLSMEWNYKKCTGISTYVPGRRFSDTDIEKAAALINGSQRPYILAGHGVLISKAEKELLALAEKAGIPVGCTLHGLSAFPTDHALYAGMLGMHGNYGANILTNKADVILAVGMRFDDRVTGNLANYARQARVIHVEIDPSEINKNVKAEVALLGDAKEVLQALTAKAGHQKHEQWLNEFKACDAIELDRVIKKDIHPEKGELKMGEVVRMLSEKTGGQAVIVADVGQHQMIAARYYKFKHTKSFISSGGLGTMGFALPAAFGVKVGAPHREVVAVIGDGCFQMTIQELGTIAQSGLPVKMIILNNNYLGMVRQWQELFFDNRYSFVELQNPDFITIAKGFGVNGKKVTAREEIGEALDEMIRSSGPFLLEVLVEKEDNVFPMIPGGASIEDIRLE